MRVFFLIATLTLSVNILIAQNAIKVSGTVIDYTQQGIPFATVSIKQTATLTDINGKFSFTVSSVNNSDSIVFSCIGYENKSLPVKNFLAGREQTIALVSKVYQLQGPDIPSLSSREIVRRAISRIPGNFEADTFCQPAFYRQYHEENDQYVRLIEADITIENKVERTSAVLKGNERVSINHLRRSNNNEKNNEEHGDHLIDLLEENPVYHSTGIVLNLKAFSLYRFYSDTTLSCPDSVYHIYYYSTDHSGERFDRGEIFIETARFAILKFTREEFINTRAPRRKLYNSSAPYRWEFLSSKLIAAYKMDKGKMRPETLMKTYTHELYDNKVNTKEFLVTEYFELTLGNVMRSQSSQNFSEFSNLYHRKYVYDNAFWQNDDIPGFYFIKSEDVKKDLEKNKKLEEQFLQNGE